MKFIKIILLVLFTVNVYANINNSVVKIFATINEPDQITPWQTKPLVNVSGSGVVIEHDKQLYILTCAHVVTNASFIQIKKQSNIDKYTAKIKYIAHDMDLALLELEDKSFFKDTKPLELSYLPQLQSNVKVIGYPKGGKDLSITKGIISRIEYSRYVHSNKKLLSIQIDAAINNGNSGGPALNDKNQIVGIAMQGMSKQESEGIGYITPPNMIKYFLKDIEDNNYDGLPSNFISTSEIFNDDIKSYYNLKDISGIHIANVLKGRFAENTLKPNDILLEIDDTTIENDKTVYVGDLKLSYMYLVHKKFIGDTISFTILRDNQIQKVSTTITKPSILIPTLYDKKPSYFTYAGFVFRTISFDYIKAKKYNVKYDILSHYYNSANIPLENKKELVMVQSILPHKINSGYSMYEEVVKSVNDAPVKDLEHLMQLIDTYQDKYLSIEFENGKKIVLNTQQVKKYNREIIQRYNLLSDRSEDIYFPIVYINKGY